MAFWKQLDDAGEGNLPTGSSRAKGAGILATLRGRIPDKVGTLPIMSSSRRLVRRSGWLKNFKRGF